MAQLTTFAKNDVKLVYWSTNPAVTHAVYAYPRFWHANGTPIDFGASPTATTLQRAQTLVRRFYPNANVVEATAEIVEAFPRI